MSMLVYPNGGIISRLIEAGDGHVCELLQRWIAARGIKHPPHLVFTYSCDLIILVSIQGTSAHRPVM